MSISLTPQTKSIAGLLRGGTAFQNPTAAKTGGIKAQIAQLRAALPAVKEEVIAPAVPSEVGSELPAIEQRRAGLDQATVDQITITLDAAEAQMDAADAHTSSQIVDLPTNLSVAKAASQFNNAMGDKPSDICTAIEQAFGLLTGAGDGIFKAISDEIQKVLDLVGDVISAITDAIGEGLDVANAIIQKAVDALKAGLDAVMDGIKAGLEAIGDFINRELEILGHFVDSLKEMAGALSLPDLFSDPCTQKVLGAVATGGLIAAVAMKVKK